MIASSLLGKGASMADGIQATTGDIVLFVDGDLVHIEPDLVQRMVGPILGPGCKDGEGQISLEMRGE